MSANVVGLRGRIGWRGRRNECRWNGHILLLGRKEDRTGTAEAGTSIDYIFHSGINMKEILGYLSYGIVSNIHVTARPVPSLPASIVALLAISVQTGSQPPETTRSTSSLRL